MGFEEPPDESDDYFATRLRELQVPFVRIAIIEAWLAEGYLTEAQARHLLDMREP